MHGVQIGCESFNIVSGINDLFRCAKGRAQVEIVLSKLLA